MRITPLLTATLSAFSLSASAFAAPPVLLSADELVLNVAPSSTPAVAAKSAASVTGTVIFSNFGTSDALYDCCGGWIINSRYAWSGIPVQQAMPFTPALPATLKQVRIGLQHYYGANQYKLSLNADANGLPGPVIRQLTVTDLPDLGTCCVVAHGGFGQPSLEAGQTYWVVVHSVKPRQADTYGIWTFNTAHARGTMAYKTLYGWTLEEDVISASLEVIGK